MDGAPQTTFIPRKPVSDAATVRAAGGNMFITFGSLVLAVAVLATGALFAYQNFYLANTLKNDQNNLAAASGHFDATFLQKMATLSNQLSAARAVLGQHTALSGFFDFLAANTVVSVRFNKFSYVSANNALTVTLNGQAANFAALDAQVAQFNQSTSILQNANFGSIAVTKTGNVTFTLTGTIPAASVSYKNTQ